MPRKEDWPPRSEPAPLTCTVCFLEPECLRWNLTLGGRRRLDNIVEHPAPFDDGDCLFRAGDVLKSLYMVRAGAFTKYDFDDDGSKYVVGFAVPGELLGFDGLYMHRHRFNAVALGDSTVCSVPYSDLVKLMGSISELREQILRLASRDFANHVYNNKMSSEQRVARFLLDLAERSRNVRTTPLRLPMSFADIASYLRLDPGKLTETFTYLRARKLIELDGQVVHLDDVEGLTDLLRLTHMQ